MPWQHGASGTPCPDCTHPHCCPSRLCHGKGPGRAELGSSEGWHGAYFPGEGQDAVLLQLMESSLLRFFNELLLGPIQTPHPLCPTPIKNWAATGLTQDFGCPASTPVSHRPEQGASLLGVVGRRLALLPKAWTAR